jgi:hypothetical protein
VDVADGAAAESGILVLKLQRKEENIDGGAAADVQ